jgi:predicted AAA+ superfamily ATPase
LLGIYFIVGGMPEVVAHYANSADVRAARAVQLRLLTAYELDFSKYASPREVPRIRDVWASIPAQLAKENAKFIYGVLRPGARAKEFESALLWLKQAGLIHMVYRCTAVRPPLKAYQRRQDFKIYLADTGLLGALAELPVIGMHATEGLYAEFKGRLAEQFVLQQLISRGIAPFYWHPENRKSEVDFVYQSLEDPAPIALEVKAGTNVRARSLKVLADEQPMVQCRRTSLLPYNEQDWVTNYALYSI